MDTDAQLPAGQRGDGECVVDLGGGGVIDAESLDLGERQVLRHCGRVEIWKCRAPREMLEQETIQVVVMR